MKPRTLDEKQAEKDRLLKKYRAAKKAEWADLVDQEPRLLDFRRAVKRSDDPAGFLTRLADSWLRAAPLPVRYAALRQIDSHANRMARYAGRTILDDPLPPSINLYLAAREMLAVR